MLLPLISILLLVQQFSTVLARVRCFGDKYDSWLEKECCNTVKYNSPRGLKICMSQPHLTYENCCLNQHIPYSLTVPEYFGSSDESKIRAQQQQRQQQEKESDQNADYNIVSTPDQDEPSGCETVFSNMVQTTVQYMAAAPIYDNQGGDNGYREIQYTKKVLESKTRDGKTVESDSVGNDTTLQSNEQQTQSDSQSDNDHDSSLRLKTKSHQLNYLYQKTIDAMPLSFPHFYNSMHMATKTAIQNIGAIGIFPLGFPSEVYELMLHFTEAFQRCPIIAILGILVKCKILETLDYGNAEQLYIDINRFFFSAIEQGEWISKSVVQMWLHIRETWKPVWWSFEKVEKEVKLEKVMEKIEQSLKSGDNDNRGRVESESIIAPVQNINNLLINDEFNDIHLNKNLTDSRKFELSRSKFHKLSLQKLEAAKSLLHHPERSARSDRQNMKDKLYYDFYGQNAIQNTKCINEQGDLVQVDIRPLKTIFSNKNPVNKELQTVVTVLPRYPSEKHSLPFRQRLTPTLDAVIVYCCEKEFSVSRIPKMARLFFYDACNCGEEYFKKHVIQSKGLKGKVVQIRMEQVDTKNIQNEEIRLEESTFFKFDTDKVNEPESSDSESSDSDSTNLPYRALIYDSSLTEEIPAGDITPYFYHIWKHYDNLADLSLLLHADWEEHTRKIVTDRLFQSMTLPRSWNWNVDFIHLGWRFEGSIRNLISGGGQLQQAGQGEQFSKQFKQPPLVGDYLSVFCQRAVKTVRSKQQLSERTVIDMKTGQVMEEESYKINYTKELQVNSKTITTYRLQRPCSKGGKGHPLSRKPEALGALNPDLFVNVWDMFFSEEFKPVKEVMKSDSDSQLQQYYYQPFSLGGYDFNQMLVGKFKLHEKPRSYYKHLCWRLQAIQSYGQFLPIQVKNKEVIRVRKNVWERTQLQRRNKYKTQDRKNDYTSDSDNFTVRNTKTRTSLASNKNQYKLKTDSHIVLPSNLPIPTLKKKFFLSPRIDLSPFFVHFNKGASIWSEHMFQFLFGTNNVNTYNGHSAVKYFDRTLPLGIREYMDNVHLYKFVIDDEDGEEICRELGKGCREEVEKVY